MKHVNLNTLAACNARMTAVLASCAFVITFALLDCSTAVQLYSCTACSSAKMAAAVQSCTDVLQHVHWWVVLVCHCAAVVALCMGAAVSDRWQCMQRMLRTFASWVKSLT